MGQDFSVRFGGEYGYGFYDVHRPKIDFLLDTHVRLGFDAGVTFMLERLPDGQLDNLNVGDLNLFYRVMSHPRAQMRFGLGWRYMIDAIGVENGFNLTFALDLFLIRPMVISANADVGNLGQALFFHGRLTIGAIIKRVEVFAGYEVMLIGPVPFHGPVGGVRVWL